MKSAFIADLRNTDSDKKAPAASRGFLAQCPEKMAHL
jgi:hypothetical protein